MTETAQHVELYKKYRPLKWASLVGQEKVAASLQAAVKANRLPTAYLFSGPRGCGKTSAARLLAKAINCENPPGDGNPCNQCEVCQNIDAGNQMGFNYISMANKGSVDDVRQLVQQARLSQPVKRQVWILDEIHNLSKAAFDALLIPLEEKDMPALFIMCSTEIDRIPQTILSRVQSRRFSLVESEAMMKLVEKIAQQEKMDLTPEQLQDVVRMGRGSARDTLTALEAVSETGETYTSFGGKLLEALATRNLTEVLKVMAAAHEETTDFRELGEQLFEDLRDLLLIHSGVERHLVGIPPVADEAATIKGLAGAKGISIVMAEVGDALTRMSMGADARIILEVALLKALANLRRAIQAAQRG